MTSLSIALLGPPEVRRGAEIVEIPIRKSLALLAYLAVTGRPQPREALAALLWPEADHQRARGALRYALAELRRAVGDWLVADRQSVGLDWSREILVDVAAFRRGAGARDLAGLREAAELWRGDFLSGFSLEDSPAFDDWQLFEAEGLRQELARCLEALVAGLIGAGQPREAIGPARRWVSLDAWHEPAHCALMEALARSGQRQAALRQYDACARTLEEGLGLRPSEETERLRQRLLADPPPARTGEPASLADAAPPAHNLPPQQTAFVGRDAELAQLAAYLADPQRRLITLAGPGGIGKTRLALQAARAAAEAGWFRDGVWFADLTAVGSAEFLAAALCRAVGQPCPPGDDPEQRLAAFVRGKELALVLDNFEQLIEQGAPLVARLLAAGGGLRLLVTSRQCLDLAEEWLIEVGGLVYPAAGERGDGSHSAVALFAARARQALGSFAPAPGGEEWLAIDRICQLVEGMPLGIELAAAWVKTLPCAQILAEIQQNIDFLGGGRRNQPDRHRGLRAVFEHSWRLLADQEQRALAQLGVFRGPFSREAALQVTQAELRVIAALIDKSLVRRSRDGGYSLHELLRQYAAEKLWAEPATEEAVRGRHARYYALFAQQQHGRWDGQQEESARLQLQTELPNICDGWRWAGAGGQPAVLELCLEPLYDLYLATHLCQEGLALFEQAAESPAAAGAPLLRARLLARQAQFCYELGRFDHGRERLRAALALREGTPPDHAELALAYELLGLIAHQQGDPAAARPLLAEAAAHARRTGDHARAAHIQLSTGSVAIALRDYPAASAALDESLMIYQRLDKQWGVGHALRFLGMVAQAEGEAGRARELYQRSLLLFQEIGNVPGETLVLLYLGDACAGDSAASRPADAGYYYRRAFELAAASQSTPMLLRVALSVSRLLSGAAGGAPRELAFLLAGLVVSHAGAGPALKQQAREVQAALAASLPPRLIDDLRRQAAGLRLEDALARAGDLALPEQAAPAVLALGAG